MSRAEPPAASATPAPGATDWAAMPPSRARFVTFLYLCALTLILYLDRMCIGKAGPAIQDELKLADWQMGVVFAAFSVAYGLFEIVTGHWGDRYGSGRVLVRIVLWWSAFTALTGASLGFFMLVAMRFLFGAGEAGALPNVTRVVDRWFPVAARGRIRGFVQAPALVGAMVAPVMTAYLIEAVGWRWVFVLFGAVGVVWAAAFALWFRESPAEHPRVNPSERDLIGPPPQSGPAEHLPLRAIFTSGNVWLLSGVLGSGASTVYLTFSWFPTYLEKGLKVSNVASGWWNGLIMAGGALGCFVGGWAADRAARRIRNLRWTYSLLGGTAFALAAAATAASAASGTAAWKSIFLAVACFAIHCHGSAWWGANSEMSGRNTAAVFGTINSAGVMAAATAQLAFGFLPQAHWDKAFFAAAALLAGGAVCWFFVDPRRKVCAEFGRGGGKEIRNSKSEIPNKV